MILQTVIVGDIETNCYIFGDEETKKGAVIDPGDCAGEILQAVLESGLAIEYIFVTHGHGDHIQALAEVKEATGAKVVASEAEAPRLAKGQWGSTPVETDILAKDGDVFAVGSLACRWLITPGHTNGSSCILAGDTLFSGDTLFYCECGRCDLPTGDYDEMLVSLKRLALLPGDYKVYPGHGPSSAMDFERQNNPYMAEGLRVK